MHASFEATSEELVDVTLRGARRSKTMEARHRRAWIAVSVLGALIVFAITPPPLEMQLLWAGIGAVIGALVYPAYAQKSFERAVRASCRERLGGRDSFPVEVDFDAQGITFKQLGTQRTYDWSVVREIQATVDRIDFLFQDGHAATVRARAFESPETRNEFAARAEDYLRASRNAHPQQA